MVAPFLNIVTLCPQTYYDIVQGDLVIIEFISQVNQFKSYLRPIPHHHTITASITISDRLRASILPLKLAL